MNIEQLPYPNLIFLKHVLVWQFAYHKSMIVIINTGEVIDSTLF